jgi:hypothetical protein
LCFRWNHGVIGLWWGLSTGLMICGLGLIVAWRRKGAQLDRAKGAVGAEGAGA